MEPVTVAGAAKAETLPVAVVVTTLPLIVVSAFVKFAVVPVSKFTEPVDLPTISKLLPVVRLVVPAVVPDSAET